MATLGTFLSDHAAAIFLLVMLGALVLFVIKLDRDRRRAEAAWEILGEGEFEGAEYGYRVKRVRSGSMVHTTSYRRLDLTVIRFADGRSWVMGGRYDMPHPRGTRLRLWRNGVGDHRIEKL